MVALAIATLSPTSIIDCQAPPPEIVTRLVKVQQVVVAIAGKHPNAIWPGFRPDTIPVLYVLPKQGVLLLNWRGDLPSRFTALPLSPQGGWAAAADPGAASTSTVLEGRSAAQVVVDTYDQASIFGTAVHEAFHVFERAVASDDRRFGTAENSFLVSNYPIFDVDNEANFTLEAKLLAAALEARSHGALRAAAQQFLAARETRHRRLGARFAEFEVQTELNEGLAEYALVRALQLAGNDLQVEWRAEARSEVARRMGRLDSLMSAGDRSVRLRFYVTGPAMALLLDRLAGPRWKTELMRNDETLQEALASATGFRAREQALLAAAGRRFPFRALLAEAAGDIVRLRTSRRALVDSLLAQSGVRLVVNAKSLPGGQVGLCGIDPQNLLQVGHGVLLHNRWVRPCAGSRFTSEFNTPVVQDGNAGTLTAVIGPDSGVVVRVNGQVVALKDTERLSAASNLRVESAVVTLEAAAADLERSGREMRVRLLAE